MRLMGWLKKMFMMSLMLFCLGIFIPWHAHGASVTTQPGSTPTQIKPDIPVVTLPQSVVSDPKIIADTSNIGLAPKAPSNLVAYSDYGQIILNWTDNSFNEDGFIIERRVNNGDFYPIDHVGPNITTYSDRGYLYLLHPNELYYYRVKAYRGQYASVSNVTTGNWYYTEEPLPVYNFKVEPLDYKDTSIKLTWVTPENKDTKYYLETSSDGKNFKTAQYHLTTKNHTNLDKKDLTVDVPYYYRIKAVNPKGSSYSDTVKVVLPHLPARPDNFQAVAQDSNSIKLTWVDKADNENGYLIYRRKMDGSYPAEPQLILGPNMQECLDTGLEADTRYFYTINPFNGNNQVVATSEITARTVPYAPINVTASIYDVNNKYVKVSWFNRSKVTSFAIERKKEGGEWVHHRDCIVMPPVPDTSYCLDPWDEPGIYYYRVYAQTVEDGVTVFRSEPSAEARVTIPGHGMPVIEPKPLEIGKKVIRLNLGKTTFNVDGQTLNMDTAPVVREGRTMLPIKYVADALGAALTWDGTTQKVTIEKGDTTIELWIGRNTARVNGADQMIDPDNPNVRPFLAPPGRTMLPLRFISENLGCTVEWNEQLKEAKLTYGG